MQATMEAALDAIAADPRNGEPSPLVELVYALRPGAGRHHGEAIANLHALTSLLTHRPTYGSALRAYLLYLIATRRPVHFYANTGIQSQEGFGRALMQKLAFRILPPALDRDSLEDILTLVFWKGDDWRWLRAIPPESWDQLFATLAHGEPGNEEDMKKVRLSILEAAQVISYRIATIGLDPEFLRNEPALEEHESPFVGQQIETRRYVVDYRKWLVDPNHTLEDDRHLEVLIDQCERFLHRIHNTAQRNGMSVRLTYL